MEAVQPVFLKLFSDSGHELLEKVSPVIVSLESRCVRKQESSGKELFNDLNAIYLFFHGIEGCASYMNFFNIAEVACGAKKMIDEMLQEKRFPTGKQVCLLDEARCFIGGALRHVMTHGSDDRLQTMANSLKVVFQDH